MTITYKAEVITIPENIEEILGIEVDHDDITNSQFYEDALWKYLNNIKYIEAGSDTYDDTYEWAIFDTLSDAENFEKKLTEFAKVLLKEIPKILRESENS